MEDFLARIDRAQEALADCDKAVSSRPRDTNILDSRGYAYFNLGQYQQAVREYDTALRINRQFTVSLYSRGVAKLKLGDRHGDAVINAGKVIASTIAEPMLKFGIAL